MKTTTSRFSTERVYGYVTFILVGKEFELPVYQSKDLIITEEYADYLFFPFTDQTNGKQTYAGGRYIDLRIPKEGDNLIVDFGYEALVKFLSKNMAYPKAAVKQKIEGSCMSNSLSSLTDQFLASERSEASRQNVIWKPRELFL